MTLRKFHRIVGLCFAPFFLVTATTGAVLLWRHSSESVGQATGTLLGFHNWEVLHRWGMHYCGVILAAGLATMAVTGIIIAVQMRRRMRKHG